MSLKTINDVRALYTEKNRIWVARGMTFYAVDHCGKIVTPKYSVGGMIEKIIGFFAFSRQLLRQGIHHLVPLPNGDIFIVAKKIGYLIDGTDGKIKNTFTGYTGNKPAHQGVCVTPDGKIFFGEYSLNMNRENESCLYRSVDGGKTFEKIKVFKGGEVRHIHFVKYDPYDNCLWMGTGDEDRENLLLCSHDDGDTWEIVGGGSQDWRAIGVCFNETSLVWGTDAGSVPDQNHVIRMDRKTREIEIVSDAEGPCHGCASFSDGRVFISTGVEGGENEKDRYARLKEIKKDSIDEILKQKKNILPLIVQYGVMRFPLGTENTDRLVFTTLGLSDGMEKVHFEE